MLRDTASRSARARVLIGLTVATLASVVVMTAPASSQTAGELELLAMMNETRAASGLAPLSLDAELTAYAESYATTLAEAGTLIHTADLAGVIFGAVPDATSGGENIGAGSTLSDVYGTLLGSAGHYENIVGGYSVAGVGVVVGADGRTYVVQMFAAAPAPAPAPAPEPAPAPAPEPAPADAVVIAASVESPTPVIVESASPVPAEHAILAPAPERQGPPAAAEARGPAPRPASGSCLPVQANGRGHAVGRCPTG